MNKQKTIRALAVGKKMVGKAYGYGCGEEEEQQEGGCPRIPLDDEKVKACSGVGFEKGSDI
jgi:hypothetical protein